MKVGAPNGGSHIKAGKCVTEDRFECQCLGDAIVHVRATKMKGPLVGSECGRELNAVAAVHPNDAGIIHPSDAELDQPLGLHECFGDKGVFGIAIENGAKSHVNTGNGVNKISQGMIASFGFVDEQLSGFESSFESDVALATEERFVSPGFGHFHGLMDPIFRGDE